GAPRQAPSRPAVLRCGGRGGRTRHSAVLREDRSDLPSSGGGSSMIYTATNADPVVHLIAGNCYLLGSGTEYEILDGKLIVRRWADDSDDEQALKQEFGVGRGEPLIFDHFELALVGHII